MFKEFKVTRRLERYIHYAKCKFEKLSIEGNINLWEVLESYEMLTKQAQYMQYYIYDFIKGTGEYGDRYKVMNGSDGGIYIRGRNNSLIL